MKHTLKTWPPYFEHTMTRVKTFEVRRDDRPYALGDELDLVEWDRLSGEATGRRCTLRIVYILGREADGRCDAHAFGLEPGFVVLGLAP